MMLQSSYLIICGDTNSCFIGVFINMYLKFPKELKGKEVQFMVKLKIND